ncbi:hypothetical protein [uncultured Serinicoccus sp.]|uniref:hypothetical protein n=1 Tax=uncultured Serinicoccus sp. TaxID=735514 RepID=UPI0026301568|nr:hypothetical protein [uncultured Serinicoccus sp.]
MSENPYEDESGIPDYSPEQEAEAEVNLDEPSSTADVAWSPPDRRPVSSEFADDDASEETIDQRIAQELPEEGTSYGRPEHGGEDTSREPELLGGDDPDAIPADQDILGGDAGEDVDQPEAGAGDAAEEAAMHVTEGEWDSTDERP